MEFSVVDRQSAVKDFATNLNNEKANEELALLRRCLAVLLASLGLIEGIQMNSSVSLPPNSRFRDLI